MDKRAIAHSTTQVDIEGYSEYIYDDIVADI